MPYRYKSATKGFNSGSPSGDSVSIPLGAGKKCTEVSLWSNGDHFNGIKIVTGDKSYKAGPCTGTETEMVLGSGIIVGFEVCGYSRPGSGNAGRVTGLRPFLLKPVKSVVVDVKKINLPNGKDGIKPVKLDQQTFSNSSKEPLDWTFGKSIDKTVSTSWTQEASLTFGQKYSVKASVPLLAEAGAETHWSVTGKLAHSSSETTQRNLHWGIGGKLSPGHTIHCKALTREGKVSVDYDSEVTVTLNSGTQFTFEEPGHFQSVDYTAVTVDTS